MRPAAAALAVALAAIAALPASCTVHRVSDDYACTSDVDCKDGRFCDQGFCVHSASGACPDPCTSCDLDNRTCRIECTAGHPCGAVHCPVGFACTIRCNNAGACGDVDCAAGRGCDLDCSGAASCGNVQCGAGACAVRCDGVAACPGIDCAASCRCDVDCTSPASECPSLSCPRAAGPCTENGSDGAPCSSSEPGCSACLGP